MSGVLWGRISAAAGVVILALLGWYGTIFGTWVDENGAVLVDGAGQAVDGPSLIPLLPVAVIAIVLFFGGLSVAVRGTRSRASE